MLGSSFTGNIPGISRQEFEAEIQALSLCMVVVFWSGVCGGGACGGGWCGGGCYAFCAKINVCLRGDTFIQEAHGHLSTVFPNYIRIAASFSLGTTIPKEPKKMQFVFQ